MKTRSLLLLAFLLIAAMPSMAFGQGTTRDQQQTAQPQNHQRLGRTIRTAPLGQQRIQDGRLIQAIPTQQAHQQGQGMGGFASNTFKAQFDTEIQNHFDSKNLPGVVVLMARDGMLVYRKAIGFADIANQTPVTQNHVFRLASVSKWVGAVMALRMEEQGQINLNAKVSSLLDGIPEHHTSRVIDTLTCRAGIRHYGGTASSLSPSNWGSTLYDSALATAPNLWNDPLAVPVSSYHYSTHSYILSAACMEQASGRSTPQLIRDELAIPFGLDTLRTEDLSLNVPARVKLYDAVDSSDFSQGNVETERDNLTWKFLGGGLESSPMDLLKLGMKFCDRQVVTQSSIERMMTAIDDKGYTIGCNSGVENGNRLIAKNGGQTGASTYLWMVPDKRMVMVVLINRKSGGATELGKSLRRIALGTNNAGDSRSDLVVEQFERTGNPAYKNGKLEVPVRIKIRNQGQGGTAAQVVNGVRLGTQYRWSGFMQTLPPNSSRTVNGIVRIPDPSQLLKGRTLTLTAMADAPIAAADTSIASSGRELESIESNNGRILKVEIPGGIGGMTVNQPPRNDLPSTGSTNPRRTNPTRPSGGQRTNGARRTAGTDSRSGNRTNGAKRTNGGQQTKGGKRTQGDSGAQRTQGTDKDAGKRTNGGHRTNGKQDNGKQGKGTRTNSKKKKKKGDRR